MYDEISNMNSILVHYYTTVANVNFKNDRLYI